MKGQKILFSHNSDSWETPDGLFDDLNNDFHFTLDPASSEHNYKCEKHYTQEEDGLTKDWSGEIVFINPPYSQIKIWVEKAYNEWLNHNVMIIMLLPARTDTKWFHKYIYNQVGIEIEFIKGRLKFKGARNSAPFPSMLVIFYSKEMLLHKYLRGENANKS